jgi:plastocyanin
MKNNNKVTVAPSKKIIFAASMVLLITSAITSMFSMQHSNHLVTAQKVNQTDNVTATNIPNTTSMTNGTWSTTKGQNRISIVRDASTLDDKAYQPNPIKIKIRDIVIWTNNDTIPHTVTSGTEGAANAGSEFDSDIIAINKTFEHKFASIGEFTYFCRVHPNMVGEIIVS